MTKSTKAPKTEPAIRPGAGGHRFGPDLQCNECGRNWDEHQHDPSPCSEAADRCAPVEPVGAEGEAGDPISEPDRDRDSGEDDDRDAEEADDRDAEEAEEAL